jgi:hypothetical protein
MNMSMSRAATPCADGSTPGCKDRVIVGYGAVEVSSGKKHRRLRKGQVAIFQKGDSYSVMGRRYFEVAIKPDHPPVKSPTEMIAASKNKTLYDGPRFFVYEERLAPGRNRVRAKIGLGPK